jgi:hypothetical protein
MRSPQLLDRVVTTGMQGVTPGYPQQREPDTLGQTVLFQSLNGIMGAGGEKTTGGPGERRQILLIQPDDGYENLAYHHTS